MTGTGRSAPSAGPSVAMLLLGDPRGDARVIKTARSLQQCGYQVSLYCVASSAEGRPMPDLGGATVQMVTAPRPLAWLAARVRSVWPRRGGRAAAPDRPAGGARGASLLAELRALAGTLWLNLALARHAGRAPAAIIHANDLDTLLAAVLLKHRLNAALVYDAHEIYSEMFSTTSPLYEGLWRALEHRLVRAADAVITVNDSIARELQRRHRLTQAPSVVMNCPPLTQVAAPDGQPTEDQPEHRLVYHGRFQAERGLEVVIQAMAAIESRVVLLLRGNGPLRAVLEEQAARHGVAHRVRFLDPLPPDRLVTELPKGSIGVVPYLPTCLNNYFCTPNKLFEYLMGGLAVAASDLPELRRVVVGSGAGVVYAPDDPQALARAVNELIAEPGRRSRHEQAARRAALEAYNWERQEAILSAVYRRLSAVQEGCAAPATAATRDQAQGAPVSGPGAPGRQEIGTRNLGIREASRGE